MDMERKRVREVDEETEETVLPQPKLWYPRSVIYDPLKAGSIDGTDSEPHDKAVWRAMNVKYTPNSKVKGVPQHTVFIAKLNNNTTEDSLKREFSRYGKIKRCRVVKDVVTGFGVGYGFVEYEKAKEAKVAVHKANGVLLDGKRVFVDFECERLLPGWIPRRLGGGFGGRKESGQLRFGGKERPFAKPVNSVDAVDSETQEGNKNSSTVRKFSTTMTHEEREKSVKKILMNWRQACDKTKDRTKELLKRTISWKDTQLELEDIPKEPEKQNTWIVHVWNTWVKRSTEDMTDAEECPIRLSDVQKDKFTHFFKIFLDMDNDDMICVQDFTVMSEKLRHFADWDKVSTDFLLLQQVQQSFVQEFFSGRESEEKNKIRMSYLSLSEWLTEWSTLLQEKHSMKQLPFWLRQLSKIFFCVINKSETGIITKEEFKEFFTSFLLENKKSRDDQDVSDAYSVMTANCDYKLTYTIYELCFANWLFGKHPNGPGQWIFGKCGSHPAYFPIDYASLNTCPEDQEPYVPEKKSNRSSVVV